MGYTVLDCKPQAVDSWKVLTTMSRIVAKRAGNASCCSTKVAIPLLRVDMTCWLWVVLLTVLLSSSGAYSAKDSPRSEEGNCHYDLTSVAALSCVQPDGVRRLPSQTCCNAILYAIDQVPPSDVSGACCLCHYLKEKEGPPGLATAYAMCNGKDRHILAKWSFPITCLDVCGQGNSSSFSTEHEDSPAVQAHDTGKGEAHGTGKGIWIVVVVVIVIGLICLWYLRRFKAAENASDPRAGRRHSIGPASAKRKEKRFPSS